MASVDVLFVGYANDRVAGTVSCVRRKISRLFIRRGSA
jgi:hypothetical protein